MAAALVVTMTSRSVVRGYLQDDDRSIVDGIIPVVSTTTLIPRNCITRSKAEKQMIVEDFRSFASSGCVPEAKRGKESETKRSDDN
jgi:hypothetical protein